MVVKVEIPEKVVSLATAMIVAEATSEEEQVKAKEASLKDELPVNLNNMGEDGKKLQLHLAVIAIALSYSKI